MKEMSARKHRSPGVHISGSMREFGPECRRIRVKHLRRVRGRRLTSLSDGSEPDHGHDRGRGVAGRAGADTTALSPRTWWRRTTDHDRATVIDATGRFSACPHADRVRSRVSNPTPTIRGIPLSEVADLKKSGSGPAPARSIPARTCHRRLRCRRIY